MLSAAHRLACAADIWSGTECDRAGKPESADPRTALSYSRESSWLPETEKVMTRCWWINTIVIFAMVSLLLASAKPSQLNTYRGTILRVEKREVQSPEYAGGDPTDAPLTAEHYAYEVSVRVSCGIYVGHYESPYAYLPSEIAAHQDVAVRLTKHDLYLDLPGEREMRLAIVHRHAEGSAPCDSSTARR